MMILVRITFDCEAAVDRSELCRLLVTGHQLRAGQSKTYRQGLAGAERINQDEVT